MTELLKRRYGSRKQLLILGLTLLGCIFSLAYFDGNLLAPVIVGAIGERIALYSGAFDDAPPP